MPGLIVAHVYKREQGDDVARWFAGFDLFVVGVGKVIGVVVVACRPGDEAVWCALARVNPHVRVAVQDRSGRSGFTVPPSEMPAPQDDPPFPYSEHNLWFLENTGQTIDPNPGSSQAGTPGADIGILDAWGLTQGSADIRVAVLDSGIYRNHPEFDGRLAAGYSYTCPRDSVSMFSCCVGSPCYFGPPEDNFGHGTPVAGVLGANVDNGTPSSTTEEQYAGVDPSCTIVPFRVSWYNGFPLGVALLALEEILSSYETSTPPIAHVVNMSFDFGPVESPPGETQASLRDILDQLKYYNCIVVNLSSNLGNGAADARAPQAWNNTITVGAIENDNSLLEYPPSGTGESLDFVAPGFGLYTAYCPQSTAVVSVDGMRTTGAEPPARHRLSPALSRSCWRTRTN